MRLMTLQQGRISGMPIKKQPQMFKVKSFDELTAFECYDIFKLRQDTFICEHNHIFSDISELDKGAHHVLYYEQERLATYMRILFEDEGSLLLTRFVVHKAERKTGLSHVFFSRVLNYLRDTYPKSPIHLYANEKLSDFYIDKGFMKCEKKFFETDPREYFHFRFQMSTPQETVDARIG